MFFRKPRRLPELYNSSDALLRPPVYGMLFQHLSPRALTPPADDVRAATALLWPLAAQTLLPLSRLDRTPAAALPAFSSFGLTLTAQRALQNLFVSRNATHLVRMTSQLTFIVPFDG